MQTLVIQRLGLIVDEVPIRGNRVLIGRDPSCDVVLQDPNVPIRLVEIVREGDQIIICDLGSLTGVWRGEQRVEREPITPDAVYSAGAFTLSVRFDAEPGKMPTLTPKESPADSGRWPDEIARSTSATQGPSDKTVMVSDPPSFGATVLVSPLTLPEAKLVALDNSGLSFTMAGILQAVGREASSAICIPDKRVSKHHANLRFMTDGWMLEDLGSTNGTEVNGKRIKGLSPLKSGDTVDFGGFKFRFESASPAPATPVARPRPAPLHAPLHHQPLAKSHHAASVPPSGKSRRLLLIGGLFAVLVVVVGLIVIGGGDSRPKPTATSGATPTPTADATAAASPNTTAAGGAATPAAQTPAAAQATPLTDFARALANASDAETVGDISKALGLYEQILASDPNYKDTVARYARLMYRVGLVYEGNQEGWRALPIWQRIIERCGGKEDPYVRKAEERLRLYALL